MRAEDHIRIRHMIDAAGRAERFLNGRERADLDSDDMLLFALVRCVEIIGEAAAKVSGETRLATPAIPWRDIVAMRNRLIHAYFDIDTEVLWQTMRQDVPPLVRSLKTVLGE